jgi:hypothetical protein
MDYKHKQLEQDLSALSKGLTELGARLSEVAKEVVSPGVSPSEKLIEQISIARAHFENTRSSVHAHAGAMLVFPLPKLADLGSVVAIESLLKASAAAEENKALLEAERGKAIAILSRVLSIIHKDSSDFKPLQECHAKISELRNAVSSVAWPHRHQESESIVALHHPSHSLVTFVENLDTLDDEKWIALETTITENYGKALFVAASRGKLTIAEAPAESETASKPVAASPAPVKAPSAAPEPAKPAIVAEKPVEKPAEKKPIAEKPAPAPVAVSPVSAPPPAPVAVPVPTPAPAAVAPTPGVSVPAASAPAATAPAASVPPANILVATVPAVSAPAVSAPPVTAAPVTEKKPAPQPASPQVVSVPLPVAVAEKKEAAQEKAKPAAPRVVSIPVVSAEKREEKKEIVEKQASPAPVFAPTATAATPAPVAASPVTATAPPPIAAPVPPAPAAAVPAAPPRPPQVAHIPTPIAAPVAANAQAPATASAPASAAAPIPVAANSLAALVTATDPAEKKSATAVATVETADKQRKEPRLATNAQPTPISKSEGKAPEPMLDDAQKSAVGDTSQRPQRWGFWRGNR